MLKLSKWITKILIELKMPVKDIITPELIEQHKKIPIKRRSKGEITREKILIAAIEILALNGIKGTTHRAIASHAQLQLSLTTYYFKDIQELIHQAFRLNSDHILSCVNIDLEAMFSAISKIEKKELRKTTVKVVLCQQLSDMTSEHLIDNIKHHAISLAVEQLMLTEIQVTPELRLLVQKHELAKILPYEQLCRFFNKVTPELDAKIMYTIFSQLQYSQLAKQVNIDNLLISQTTRRIISWIMSLK
jgi:DNA-binding transcriptional regulator YbjK